MTGIEITDLRFCLAFSWGLNLKMQSDSKEIPAIRSNGGASLCQLITAPGGYSVRRSSANSSAGIERCAATLFTNEAKAAGISFPFVRDLLSKL